MIRCKFTLLCFIISAFAGQAKVLNLSSGEVLEAQKKGVIIVDIRTSKEWSKVGTIPNVHRIMFFDHKRQPKIAEFMTEFEKLVTKKDQPFVLVCRSGSRTGVVTKFLDQKLGYKNGGHLEHGMKQWIKEGRKIEK